MPTSQELAVKRLRSGKMSKADQRDMLEAAAFKGWTSVLRAASQLKGVNAIQPNWTSLLRDAASRDHVEAVRFLLKQGANPNAAGIVSYCGPATLKLLAKAGANLNGRKIDRPLIHALIWPKKPEKAMALIAAGASVNVADEQGITALMHAAALGRVPVFEALLAKGADLYAVDKSGRSVIRHIAESMAGSGTHMTTPSWEKKALRIARQLRDMLPAQPEDQLLLMLMLGRSEELEKNIVEGLAPETIIPGAIGLLGMTMDDLRDRMKGLGGFFAASAAGQVMPSQAERDNAVCGTPLLAWATALKQEPCMRVLLKHGADPKFAPGGVSAFSIATIRREQALLDMFKKHRKKSGKK